MIRLLRTIPLIAFGILGMLVSTCNLQAQICGRSFAQFTIADSKGKTIPNVTIEIIGQLPTKDFWEFEKQKGYVEHGQFSYKLSPEDADEILKHRVPLDRSTDVCNNPLKQLANSTKVKTLRADEPSVKNFGFCA